MDVDVCVCEGGRVACMYGINTLENCMGSVTSAQRVNWLQSCTDYASLHIPPPSQASLDEPTQTIVMHHTKPNKLQSQALLLAEKVREK